MIIRPDGESLSTIITEKPKPGLSTGIKDLDEAIAGLRPAQLIMVAAVSGLGKSSLMADLTIAGAKQVPVGCFSIEMGLEMTYERLVCNYADINYHRLTKGDLAPSDLKDYENARKQLDKLNDIVLDDWSDTMYPSWILKKENTPENSLEMAIQNYYDKYGCRLFLIDYIQYVDYGFKIENETLRIKELTKGLHKIAVRLQVPIVAFAQLKKEVGDNSREDHTPTLSDIRDSGFIINDSDIIILLHRPDYFKKKAFGMDLFAQKKEDAQIIVAKQRGGPTGDIDCRFHTWSMRWVGVNDEHNDLGV